jgi:tetratricopeptide (TPR) repeat protein
VVGIEPGRKRRVSACAATAFVVALGIGSAAGAAPPTAAEAPDARQLFQAGQAAFAAGDFVEAAQTFEAAYKLSNRYQLLWNIALSYRRQWEMDHDFTKLRRAIAVYRNFLELAPPDEQAEATAALASAEAELAAATNKVEPAPALHGPTSPPPSVAPPQAAPPKNVATGFATNKETPKRKRVGLAVGATLVALGMAGAVTGVVLAGVGFSRSDGDKSGNRADYSASISTINGERGAGVALVAVGAAAIVAGAVVLVRSKRDGKFSIRIAPTLGGFAMAGAFQ